MNRRALQASLIATAFLTLAWGNAAAADAQEPTQPEAAQPEEKEGEPDVVAANGSATWALKLVIPVTINVDTGTGKQSTSTSYAGDMTCRCVGTDFFGLCNHYFGLGDWKVKWYDTRWEGDHSRINIAGSITENVYHVQAESRGYFSEACNLPLHGAYILGQGLAQLRAQTFHDLSGAASGYTQVGVSVPLSGASVAVPGLLFFTSGSARWSGSTVHWDFHYDGSASVVSPTVVLPATGISVYGKSLA